MNQRKRKVIGSSLLRPVLVAATFACVVSVLTFAPQSFQSTAKSDSTGVSTATYEGRMAVFDDAWSTINERYYDRTFSSLAGGLSWDKQRTVFRALAAETTSTQEFYAVLRRMVASLNDPHTRVFTPGEKFDWWRPRFVTIGISIKEIDGLPTVVKVDDGSLPDRAGIVPGDVVETVNQQPAMALVQRRLADYASPGVQIRSRIFGSIIDGPPHTVVELGWRRKDGKKQSAQFVRYWQERELGLRFRKSSGFAIIEMDGFTGATSRGLVTSLKKSLKDVRGIVLDLRGNGGGDAEAMTDVASTFLDNGFSLGRFVDRSGRQIPLITREKSPMIPSRLTRTSLPLVVLTSDRTSSAAEIFVAGLRASRRAAIIGTETCGCVLAIRNRHQLPDGGILDVSELDYQTASGQRLEKNGIEPDETVKMLRQDLYSGRDHAIELAIKRLRRKP